jgi:hypothetical protein
MVNRILTRGRILQQRFSTGRLREPDFYLDCAKLDILSSVFQQLEQGGFKGPSLILPPT